MESGAISAEQEGQGAAVEQEAGAQPPQRGEAASEQAEAEPEEAAHAEQGQADGEDAGEDEQEDEQGDQAEHEEQQEGEEEQEGGEPAEEEEQEGEQEEEEAEIEQDQADAASAADQDEAGASPAQDEQGEAAEQDAPQQENTESKDEGGTPASAEISEQHAAALQPKDEQDETPTASSGSKTSSKTQSHNTSSANSRASSARPVKAETPQPVAAAAAADPFEHMSLEELEQALQQQETDNAMLIRETHCLERFWDRQEQAADEMAEEPFSATQSLNQATARAAAAAAGAAAGGAHGAKDPSRARTKSTKPSNVPQTLTDAQKGDIAQRDLEFLQANFKRFCKESDRIVHGLMANIEEAQVRLGEIPKLQAELIAEVVEPGKSSRSGKPETEALQRFLQKRIKQCRTMVDKLDVKSTAMKGKQMREESQLKSKEDVGGALHKVDFEQLKIENTRFAEVMDDRNHELLNLKVVVGNTNTQLMTLKKRLGELTVEEVQLKKEINHRDELLQKVDHEIGRVEMQTAKMHGVNTGLKRELSEYRAPNVMDLVKEQAALPELRKTAKTLQRKLELAKNDLARTQRTVRATARKNSYN